jgi:hypothetical protein
MKSEKEELPSVYPPPSSIMSFFYSPIDIESDTSITGVALSMHMLDRNRNSVWNYLNMENWFQESWYEKQYQKMNKLYRNRQIVEEDDEESNPGPPTSSNNETPSDSASFPSSPIVYPDKPPPQRVEKPMGTRSSDVFNYLIILKEKDQLLRFWRCYQSRADSIRKLENEMSGNLHIGFNNKDVCICHNKPYVVKNLIQTNQIYIQLPREKSYVLANNWSLEFAKSQINEFIELLSLLGAKTIKYTVTNLDYGKIKQSGGFILGLEYFGFSVKSNAGSGHETTNSNALEGKLEFENNKAKFNSYYELNKYIEEHSAFFMYYRKRSDWRDMAKNRFESNTKTYSFSFTNDHVEDNDFDVSFKFKKVGVSYDNEKSNHNNFTTSFDIEFEPK